VLFRLTYLGVTNTLALLRLVPMSDRDKDAEILALRHQSTPPAELGSSVSPLTRPPPGSPRPPGTC
jgi:hypothetical protein